MKEEWAIGTHYIESIEAWSPFFASQQEIFFLANLTACCWMPEGMLEHSLCIDLVL